MVCFHSVGTTTPRFLKRCGALLVPTCKSTAACCIDTNLYALMLICTPAFSPDINRCSALPWSLPYALSFSLEITIHQRAVWYTKPENRLCSLAQEVSSNTLSLTSAMTFLHQRCIRVPLLYDTGVVRYTGPDNCSLAQDLVRRQGPCEKDAG